MSKIIRANTYKLVDDTPFELRLPVSFQLWLEDTALAEYKVSSDKKVQFKELCDEISLIPTNCCRALTIGDIYFLLSSRVFPATAVFAQNELARFGLTEYNPYEIICKTHGILPNDKYWIKFPHEALSYNLALNEYKSYYSGNPVKQSHTEPLKAFRGVDDVLADSGGKMSEQNIEALLSAFKKY